MPALLPATLLALLSCPQQANGTPPATDAAPAPAPAPAPAQGPTVLIAGRVVDLRGEGLPAAKVWTTVRKDPEVTRSTTTDAEGYFRLGRVPESTSYVVHATKQGYSVGRGYTRGEQPTTTIAVHHATTVTGILMGMDGKPVADTVVAAAPAGRALSMRQVHGTTDGEGRFRIEHVPLGLTQINAFVPGSGLAQLRHHVRGDDTVELRVAKLPMTSIQVTIDGLPKEAPPVALTWHPYVDHYYIPLPPPLEQPMVTGGVWQADTMPDWNYTITPGAEGFVFQPDRIKVEAGAGPHQIGFSATATVANENANGGLQCPAIVTDWNGEPVGGITFVMRRSNGRGYTKATSDKEGKLTFASHLAQGTKVIVYSISDDWVVDQKKTKGMQGARDRRFLEDHECTVQPTKTLQLRVTPATTVRGRLLRPDGRPAAFVNVQIEEDMPNRWPRWMRFARARTDREGRFVFPALHHSPRDVRILVEGRDGFATGEPFSIDEVGAKVRLADLTLSPPASIEGIVTDKDRKPVPGVTVWLRDWEMGANRQRSGGVTEVITDRDGRFRFVGVPVGGAWLQIVEDERADKSRRVVDPFAVEAGQTYTFKLDYD